MTVTRQPTVCHLLHNLSIGGAEILAREFAHHATDQFRIVFACLDECGELGEQLRQEGYHVEILGRKPGFDYRCARGLARFVRREQVALIHAHQYAPFFYAALSRIGGRSTPILFMEHGRDYPDYPRPKRKLANKVLLRKYDRVVAVGECVRQALIDNEGLDSARVEVIYNGVDISRYDAERPLRSEVRRELNLRDDEVAIAQVGRLNRLKDHPTAVLAMAQLISQYENARLLLVGDGEERPAIERLIGELDLDGHVTLLGTRNDIPRLLQAADVFLLSSLTEGIPLTLIEAMCTALPCVATRVGGNAEVVVDGDTGLLSEASHTVNLAANLERMCLDGELRTQFGRAGLQRAIRLFDDRQMHRGYQRIYREMLGIATDPDAQPPSRSDHSMVSAT